MQAKADIRSSHAKGVVGKLRNYFLRRGRSYAEAEDLAQDVMVRAYSQSDDEKITWPYLFASAMNLLRDGGRRAAVRSSRGWAAEQDAQEMMVGNVEEITPERILIGKDAQQRLIILLGELDERTRSILMLKRLEGWTNREIAVQLGISVSSVEKHAARGIAHLARGMSYERG